MFPPGRERRKKKKICLYPYYNPHDMYICTRTVQPLSPCLYACKLVTLKKHLFPHLTHYHSNVSTKKDRFFGCAWLHLALEIRSHRFVRRPLPPTWFFFFFFYFKQILVPTSNAAITFDIKECALSQLNSYITLLASHQSYIRTGTIAKSIISQGTKHSTFYAI